MITITGGDVMQPTTKFSRQRQAILRELRSRNDHPTADVIYQQVRKFIPNISLGTVYRNLTVLAEHGYIRRLPVLTGSEHFDGNPNPHYHFKCECCGAVSDVEIDFMPDITNMACPIVNGTVTTHNIIFEGKCNSCA